MPTKSSVCRSAKPLESLSLEKPVPKQTVPVSPFKQDSLEESFPGSASRELRNHCSCESRGPGFTLSWKQVLALSTWCLFGRHATAGVRGSWGLAPGRQRASEDKSRVAGAPNGAVHEAVRTTPKCQWRPQNIVTAKAWAIH